MSPATVEPSAHPGRGAELRQALEQAGWRLTRQRAAVFDCLRSVDTHPTAEEVYAAVRTHIPNISLATVYKALEALVDCGLATKLDYADGPARYDHRTDAHYHLRCLATGQVRDLPMPGRNPLLLLNNNLLMRMKGFYFDTYGTSRLGEFAQDIIFLTPNKHGDRLTLMVAKRLDVSTELLLGDHITLITSKENHKKHEISIKLIL